jgi:gliding motility-associated-like protein/uncharacterized repeat protein (TIGR01451 family)
MIMKQLFTQLKRTLFLLLFYAGFSSQATQAQAVSEVITTYGGYWKSGVGAINPIKPENSHDVLAFTFNGQRYSTGVNDALLTTSPNNDTFSAQFFQALPFQYFTGTPTSQTFIGLGQLYDGVDNGGNTVTPPLNDIPTYLTDGVNGLNIGTCVANIPAGYIHFAVTEMDPNSIGDGVPDILISQIAQPSGATDEYAFVDGSGNVVGNTMNIVLMNIAPVGNWIADFYQVTANPMVVPAGFVNTERPIRLWAADLSSFGITAENYQNIKSFKIHLQGTSDIAFIAYNFSTVVITPLPSGIALQKEGTYVDSNNNCVADAGDTINYTFNVVNTGEAALTNVTVTDPLITVSGGPINLAANASDSTTFTGTYTITAADVAAGAVYNQATATATNPQDATITSGSLDPTPISTDSPFYNADCPNCTVTVLPVTLTATAPVALTVEGCGTDAITGLPYSETSVAITFAQFLAAGGLLTNPLATITYHDSVSGTCPLTVTRTFSITGCLTVDVAQTITIQDSVLPTASNPEPITVEGCNQPFPAPSADAVTDAADNCSTPVVAFVSDSEPVVDGCSETVTRTYSVTDACGNSIAVTQLLTRHADLVPPTATAPAAIVISDYNQELPAADVTLITDAADNCGTPTVTFAGDSEPTIDGCSQTVTRTYNITDSCGNVLALTQSITRNIDVDAPVAPTLADVVAPCAVTVTAPIATDTCAGDITGTTSDPLTYSADGTYVITWTFDDGHGNVTTATQNVIINSGATPTPPVLADVTGECSATATVPTVVNGCTNATITGTTSDELTYNTQGTFVIHWSFDYGNNVVVTATQNVIVDDITAPVVPALDTVQGDCTATVAVPTTTDNCAGTITGTTADPLTYDAPGVYNVTWTFSDGDGNVSSATQTVIVNSTAPGTAPVLADLTGECSVTATAPTAPNGCGNGTVTGTTTDPTTYNAQGTFVITWSFVFGNVTLTSTQNVIVHDVTAPTAPSLQDATGSCTVTVTAPVAVDNCSGNVTATTDDPLTYSGVGTYLVHWTFTDAAGNTSTSNQNVVVTEFEDQNVTGLADCNNDISLIVDLSTFLPSGVPAGGTWTDQDATGGLQGNSYAPYGIPVGTYMLQYTVPQGECSRTINLALEVDDNCPVLPCGTILVHNAITPNNDGQNDTMIIDGITEECYTNNSIEIFNRWGVLVYDAKNYNNTTVVFRGQSEGRSTLKKAEELPSGTYFYVLKFTDTDGNTTQKANYLYISR